MFDPTFHIGDLVALVTMGGVAYQRVAGTLKAIERFMSDSQEDRLAIHRRLDLVEETLRELRHRPAHAPRALAEERLGQ